MIVHTQKRPFCCIALQNGPFISETMIECRKYIGFCRITRMFRSGKETRSMMTISGVTGSDRTGQTRPLGANRQEDSLSKSIRQQITNARERLQSLSENQDMTPEAKMKKRQELQQEITGLEQQLRQHQIQQRKEQRSQSSSMDDMLGGSKRPASRKAGRQGNGMSKSSMEAMISADTSMKQARVQGGVAARMEGRAGVLEAEIKQDKNLGVNVEQKEKELADLKQRAQELNGQQISTLAQAGQELQEASREEAAAKDTEAANGKVNGQEAANGKVNGKETEDGIKGHETKEAAAQAVQAEGRAADPQADYHPVDIRL